VTGPVTGGEPEGGDWQDELVRLDNAVYSAIAQTPTPMLDRVFRRISRAADHSKLWLGSAGILALTGPRGRRAASDGLASVALTSLVVNLLFKPLAGRRRPDRRSYSVPPGRRVRMPVSRSFPSGHAASAFAFVNGVGMEAPEVGSGLTFAAGLVAYSRVHTGVHYPGDVLVGSLIGTGLAPIAVAMLKRYRA
jgi:membrane-associated phospholipid phosphatase